MKYLLIFAMLLFGVTGFAQDKEATVKNNKTIAEDMSFTAADTINESETYYVEVTNKQSFPQMYDVWVDVEEVSGTSGLTITVYGKKFEDDTYVSIGTPVSWSDGDGAFNYPVTTAQRYRYVKVEIEADATDQQSLVNDVIFKAWNTGGDLSYASMSLSGNLAVTGTSTLTGAVTVTGLITANSGVTLGDGDDLIGSATSDITFATDKFTVAGASGNTVIAGTLDVTGAVGLTAGADLGTSQALVGTTAMTIGAGTQTVAVNSSDWDIDATGIATGMGAFTTDGIITAGAGVTNPTQSTHIWPVGGSVVLATAGTDAACSDGDRYWTEVMIPNNATLTGISYLVGSVGGTDSVVVQLCNSAGVEVATSRDVGTAADIVGTTAEFQSVDFDTPYAATAGVYYVAVQFNGTTAKFRAYPIPGSPFVAGTVAGTWNTKADITPGTTFTVDVGPICVTY